MINDDDEINEFSPDSGNDDTAKEYNPYSEFLNDLDEDVKSDSENATPLESEDAVPLSDNPEMENQNVEEHITTEEDIELPDFLRTAADVNDFRKQLKKILL